MSSGKCRYFDALIGTDEPYPTGCADNTGECRPFEEFGWDVMEDSDCDMVDLIEDEDDGN
jgi:hypothetical protein